MSAIASIGSAATAVHTMTGASPPMPAQQKMSKLFDKIDTAGNGSISSAQFQQAFRTMKPPAAFRALGSEAVYAKLDPQQTGSVSKTGFVRTMSEMSQSLRAPPATAPAQSAPGPASDAKGGRINTSA